MGAALPNYGARTDLQWIAVDTLIEVPEVRLDLCHLARIPPVAPVEDQAFINPDRFEQPVRPDIGDQRVERLALEEGQEAGVRVGFHFGTLIFGDGI